tara:strand:+ start:102 stop:692 length:591 start_codon:yes stop_codon:yes gene_type:complete
MSSKDYKKCTDPELMVMIQNDDRKAFNEFVSRYNDRILNFIDGIMNNRQISQDLTQDTFLKVWVNKNKYQPIASPSTWTHTIAKNCALTEYRKIKRRNTYSFSQLSNEDHEFKLERVQGEENSELSNDNATYKDIRRAISQLPDEFRTVITLKDIQEHSYDEISNITGLPLGTVKSRINRGRQKIKEIIEQDRRNS